MKMSRIVKILFAFVLLGCLGIDSASAQGPIGADPASAIYIDNQPRTLPANAGTWFRFDYDASNPSTITIQLVNGTERNLRFDVWTPDAIADIANNQPMGRGAAFTIACPPESTALSGCQTKNLIWAGTFWESGGYYIQVWNDNAAPASAILTIDGYGVAAAPPATSNAPITNSVIAAVDDPNRAMPIDGQQRILAAGAAVWHRFDYDATDRPQKTVLLVNGNHSGVRFEVYTPDRLSSWWQNTPVGRGTVYMLDCDTHEESETGECESPYLKWAGKFVISWTVYVRVINTTGHPAGYILTLQ